MFSRHTTAARSGKTDAAIKRFHFSQEFIHFLRNTLPDTSFSVTGITTTAILTELQSTYQHA
jgi:hypothetical protein